MLENPQRKNWYLNRSFWCSLIAATILAKFALAQQFEPVAVLTGIASVKDGDGLLFGNVEIRLQGIAAPELDDKLGRESKEHLKSLASGKQVTCYLDGTRAGKSKRPVAVCKVDGRDLGELQVMAGMALDCAAFSKGRYAKAEQTAFESGKNLRAAYRRPKYCK